MGFPWQLWGDSMIVKQISLGFSRIAETLGSFPVAGRAEGLSTFFFQVLSCLAILLRKQGLEAWGYPVTLQVYHGLLSFTVHAKPKVRLWLLQNQPSELGWKELKTYIPGLVFFLVFSVWWYMLVRHLRD